MGTQSIDTMDIPWHILIRDDLQPAERFTLTVLYLHANPSKELTVYPSNERLAQCTGVSVRAIARHLKKLEKLGLIERFMIGVRKRHVRLSVGVKCHERHVTPASRDTSVSRQVTPVACDNTIGTNQLTNQREVLGSTAPPLSGDNPAPKPVSWVGSPYAPQRAQVRSAPAPRPTPEVETRDGAQQSIAGCDPGDGAERPRKLSKRDKWIDKRWVRFWSIHYECQMRLIKDEKIKRHSSFQRTPNGDRMLARLYREKYTQENLNAAWLEFAMEAERTGDMRYFKPATCFVAANIDRKLQFIAEREAREE